METVRIRSEKVSRVVKEDTRVQQQQRWKTETVSDPLPSIGCCRSFISFDTQTVPPRAVNRRLPDVGSRSLFIGNRVPQFYVVEYRGINPPLRPCRHLSLSISLSVSLVNSVAAKHLSCFKPQYDTRFRYEEEEEERTRGGATRLPEI